MRANSPTFQVCPNTFRENEEQAFDEIVLQSLSLLLSPLPPSLPLPTHTSRRNDIIIILRPRQRRNHPNNLPLPSRGFRKRPRHTFHHSAPAAC